MRIAALMLLLAATIHAYAQNELPATLTSSGRATVTAEPNVIEFRFQMTGAGDSIAAAATPLAAFEDNLRAAFRERELTPLSLNVSGLAIPPIEENQISVYAAVTLPVVRYAVIEERIKAMSELYTEIRELAAALKATVQGPTLNVDNPQQVEQQAVARATENALYKADAVAQLMDSEVYAVQDVTINSVEWNADPAEPPANLAAIHCTAHVTVRYLYAPSP